MGLSLKYTKELFFRSFIMLVVIVLAILIHRFFLSSGSNFIGAIVIIILLTLGLLIYYLNIFHKRTIHDVEFIISFIIIFFLTITLFAMIYDTPCSNGNCFLNSHGQELNLIFSDSLYYSTTIITTLGPGIEPLGVFKYFVMAEVLLGLIYVGLMIYFLTRVIEKHN